MTTETTTTRANNFVTSLLPWLLGAGMFAVFLVTLYHWVTPTNLGEVVDISGRIHGSHVIGPGRLHGHACRCISSPLTSCRWP